MWQTTSFLTLTSSWIPSSLYCWEIKFIPRAPLKIRAEQVATIVANGSRVSSHKTLVVTTKLLEFL